MAGRLADTVLRRRGGHVKRHHTRLGGLGGGGGGGGQDAAAIVRAIVPRPVTRPAVGRRLLAARVGGFVAEQHCALELTRIRISALALHLHAARHPSPRQEIAAHGAQAADARGVAVLEALRRVERVDPKDDECEPGELPRDGGGGLGLGLGLGLGVG